MLLQWAILEPAGPLENLAAVRFSSPVRIRSLRIFPTGARPFKQNEEIIASTEPGSLYLDVYFNAQPIATDGKQKPKASNALIPTCIAYQGSEVEFSVDMGLEFATRLMIIRGKFEKLSLAVYGDIVSDSPPPVQNYEAKQLPQISHHALSPYLDPSNSIDPTQLAQNLLTLIPNAPTLPLITRLMFCLKPSNDDWDEPEFPYLFSDLEKEFDDLDLERAAEITTRPVSDNISDEILRKFAQRLGESTRDYNDDQAYYLAKVLAQCAPQHPLLVRYIVGSIDIPRMYAVRNLDRPTLLYLVDAAASLEVSKQLNNEQTLEAISKIRDDPVSEQGARRAANRLYQRIKGWEVLEDSLSNTQAPFSKAAAQIKDIALDESSFGIWLENMVLNRDILDRLLENLLPGQPLPHPPSFLDSSQICSHDDFIAFLRAFIGVAAVIAVYAWSDSVPVENCRERTISVLRLWQTIEGYREIVNHLLLMRQMTYRLEVMLPLPDDLPTQASIDAEHILKELAFQPISFLRPDFVKVMQNLQAPLNYITDNEILAFKKAAEIAKSGLSGCIRVLTKSPEELSEVERMLDLRIAVAIVTDVLEKNEDGEQEILDALWREGYNTLSTYVISHLVVISDDLRSQFSLSIPPQRSQSQVASLFRLCRELLDLLSFLLHSYPIPSRYLTSLTHATAEIFVCTDSADQIYAQESAACSAAHCARQLCIDTMSSLISPQTPEHHDAQKSASVVLKALFLYGSDFGNHDAAHHMTQVFWLLDHILPFAQSDSSQSEESQRMWTRHVFPSILPELENFYLLQESENRVHLIRRFRELDNSVVGVAEWLLLSELRALAKSISITSKSEPKSLQKRIGHWQTNASLHTLSSLAQKGSNTSEWATDAFVKEKEISMILQTNLTALLDLDYFYETAMPLIVSVARNLAQASLELRTAILGHVLRMVRCTHFETLDVLRSLTQASDMPPLDEKVAQELGDAIEVVGNQVHSGRALPEDSSNVIFDILDALTPLDKSRSVMVFRGVREASFNGLTQWLADALSVEKKTKLGALVLRWTVAGNPRGVPNLIPANYQIEAPLEQWDELLSPPAPVPSTPKRRSPAQTAEMVGMITVSPPNALLRSPEVKGLTKVYANNDFRQLRQLQSGRQNTSRLPSTHVDDFVQGAPGASSIAPLNLSASPPSPITFTSPQRPMAIDPMLPMNPNYYQQQQ